MVIITALRDEQIRVKNEFLTVLSKENSQKNGLIDVLEVGGGSRTKIDLPGTRFTSLDIDEHSLSRSTYADRQIVGDAQIYGFSGIPIDIAVFWNVLEHIENPGLALRNVASSVGPTGSIVVAGPLLRSLKGIVTRLTPHWVHVLFYRVVGGKKSAGTVGQGPFQVEHDKGCDIDELVGSLRTLGFGVVFRREYRGVSLNQLNEFSPILYRIYRLVSAALRRATSGKWGSAESDFILIARKGALAAA
ncbi:MAG TPA: methyltransferase domain-containing protein [Sphingomonas sp.]|jgi:hypothetical protein|uniref:class I SAM-dependent methyltransferase n=1 Tax=Sphingomonas sp. TaxID=28214 RepID=UPI002ED7FA69